ncbi:beta-ketoacyl synthase domain-containing protein [Stagonosporopsis vannaccii]|nr:beta-ketoacyl synthase domain-containing protein [Stagonosporopsis vannaccii]
MVLQSSSRPNEPIAIIGTGIRFPGDANTPAKLWDLLINPRDVQSIIPPSRFNADGFCDSDTNHGMSHTRHGYFLSEDHRLFDADFFGIKPVEATSMDPQQRMLLEVIYEGLEAAGLSVEAMRGSSTAVYVGLMSGDYGDMLNRDTSDFPPYIAAGTARSMMSNRVSYVFDWRGPSMTIDTACSSSLVALHHAVQALRLGESRVAVAAGANLILGPEQFIAGSNMKMMSPEGRSYMWDSRANGYARGEGIAAVVLKTLSAAIADGDHIECVVVETGLNQDGRTKGLTVPSAAAQTSLIETTYRKAGLDLDNVSDRPQYFEAHGTGTPAGDPVEAQAIRDAFFKTGGSNSDVDSDPLYCGSIKTIIGHTEGTAGLAGLIKASLAVQNSTIPPNRLFESLAPSVEPFYKDLEIITEAKPWPALAPGAARRASVNSFGFGGTNAHCILESYSPEMVKSVESPTAYLPFVFSAASEKSLLSILAAYSHYLKTRPSVDLRALSYTLCSRRTSFSIRVAFSAANVQELCHKLDSYVQAPNAKPTLAASVGAVPLRILGIFTGQGAQWPGMARRLMQFPAAVKIVDRLERSLAELPDPPPWSLKTELAADVSSSRVKEAAIAQPICTAAQILVVELLRAAGVRFSTVVGHSSGEIAAAFAADRLSARDAIRIAYYRGVHLPLVGGINGEAGAMMAVSASYEEAQAICSSDRFRGKLCVGASNSTASVTLSGDVLAVHDVKDMFHAQNRFARLLRVDNAYHSHHMTRCSEAISASLRACNITFQHPSSSDCTWVSSVDVKPVIGDVEIVDYWHRNTIGCVLFSQALEHALRRSDFDIAVEVGAHPALKGPALQVIESVLGHTIPYTGMLSRNVDDAQAFCDGLGYLWTNIKDKVVDFAAYDRFASGLTPPRTPRDLPLYPWDHERAFWYESRSSHTLRHRPAQHELLGTKTSDYSTDQMAWKKYIVPKQAAWINGHRIQGQTIFPGSAYIVSALEAAREAAAGQAVQLIELTNLVFGQPLIFDSDDTRIEVLSALTGIKRHKSAWTANFTYHSVQNRDFGPMLLNASCQVRIVLGADMHPLQEYPRADFGMIDVDHERIYALLASCGYHYSGAFKALHSVKRRIGMAAGMVRVPESTATTSLIHPATLDAAIHSIAVAHSYPGDGRLTSVLLPIDVSKISIDLSQAIRSAKDESLRFRSFSRDDGGGDVDIYSTNGSSAILQLEGLRTKPMVAATPSNDIHMFSETVWGPAFPVLDDGLDSLDTAQPQQDLQIMAEIATQLSHRYPAMNILNIGTRAGDATNHFLTHMDGAFASFTYTDVSHEGLDEARLALDSFEDDSFEDKIVYKIMDMSTDVANQDFVEHSFDLVVSFSNSADIPDLDHTVKTIRRLLKPGGYLLCLRLVDISQLMPDMNHVVGPDSKPLLTASNVLTRTNLLETYGFAETEWLVGSQCEDISLRPVMLLQAIDDRVQILREPLRRVDPSLTFSGITIVGSATPATSSCAKNLKTVLDAYSTSVALVKTLGDVVDSDLSFGGNVVLLQDHDEPLFSDFQESTLKGLQTLFRRSRDVLWVTHGYKRNLPHARMLVAFARCLVQEMSHIRLQILDVSSTEALDTAVISESFLRLLVTGKWEDEGRLADMLWSVEPEISHLDGRQFVPRVKLSNVRNSRYNSSRRVVSTPVDTRTTPVTLAVDQNAYILKAKAKNSSELNLDSNDTVSIRVIYSSSKAIRVDHCGYYYLLLGTNTVTNERVVALSSTVSSVIDIPRRLVRSCPLPQSHAVGYLQALLLGILSTTALEDLAPGQSLLVLEPHENFAPVLTSFAAAQDVRVVFCTTNLHGYTEVDNCICKHVPSSSSKREIKTALLGTTPSRILCWEENGFTSNVLEMFANDIAVDTLSSYIAWRGSSFCPRKISKASSALDHVLDQLARIDASTVFADGLSLPLQDLHRSMLDVDDMTIVNWSTTTNIPMRVEPADQQVLFRSDRTYWLVGLTGDLGLSLCEWMIARNAKHVVLSSRSPNIDPAWLSHFASLGAVVKVYNCDVTDFKSVDVLHGKIREQLPPLAGVCHGAMVLRDSLIQDLEIAQVDQVLKPKVDGAIHLDRVFQHHDLDFFVMFSSIAAVTGNPGQAAYAAGNGFLAALTAQRRARGQPASCIALGAILGSGYATRGLTAAQQTSLEKAGVMWTSEQDFHTAFAEAVLASPPRSDETGEFGTGVPITYTDEQYKPKHSGNPIFSHLLLQRASSQVNPSDSPTMSTKAQLLRATTPQDVLQILEVFLASRLRKALQMVSDADVLDQTAEALGIDSLIAVEMKSWLMRELKLDIPVLVIIGGNTMRGVLGHCIQLLDPTMTPLLKLEVNKDGAKSLVMTEPLNGAEGAVESASLQPASYNKTTSGTAAHTTATPPGSSKGLFGEPVVEKDAALQLPRSSRGEGEVRTSRTPSSETAPEAMAVDPTTKTSVPVAVASKNLIVAATTSSKDPVVTAVSRSGSTESSMRSQDSQRVAAGVPVVSALNKPSRASRLRRAFLKRFSFA